MANAVVNRQVNVYINSGEAAKAYDKLIAKEKILNAELAKTTDPNKIKILGRELDKLKEPIDRAAKKMRGELAPSIRELELATRKFLNEFKKTGDPETLKNFQQFNAQLLKAKQQITGMSDANNKLTQKGIFSAAFWGNLAANGLSRFTSFMSSAISDSIELGKQAGGIQNRFEKLNNPQLLAQLRSATRGTVSDLELMKAAIRADNFKIPLEKLGTLLKFASQRARETGESVEYLVESIILGISRKSIPIMDNLGISATELQKKFKETGDFGKAAFEIVNQELAKSGDYVETAADETDRLSAEFANLKTEIGQGLLPAVNKLLSALATGMRGIRNLGAAIYDELNGKSGFSSMAQSEVRDNPVLVQAIAEQTDAVVASVTSAQKQIEEQMGRKLDMNNKEDAALLKQNQDLRIKGIQAALVADEQELQDLIKRGKRTDQLEVRSLTIMVEAKKNALIALQNSLNKPATAGKKELTEEEIKAAEEARKKALQERLRLLEDIKKIEFDLSLYGKSQFDKDNKLLDKKYTELRVRAKNDNAILLRIEQLYLTERLQLIDSYTQREIETWQRAQAKTITEADKSFMKNINRLKDRLKTENDNSVKRATKFEEDRNAEDDEAEKQRILAKIDMYAQYANQVASILDTLNASKTQQENAELERDRVLNERKQRNLENRLRKGQITQQQYDRELQAMQREQDKKEKEIRKRQFERNRRQSLVQVAINSGEAVSKTIAENGMPAAIPFLIVQGVLLAAQLAAIAGQKAPEFAQGGKLGGRSHSTGGNAVIDGSGQKIAEVESGEAIVNKHTMADNSRYSVSGTPSQIISRLNAMNGVSWESGATLVPGWASSRPQRMNYSAMQRVYAAGGILGEQTVKNETVYNPIFEQLAMTISNMQATIDSLQTNGIAAYTVLTQQEKQQARLDAIRSDATMRG